MRKSGNWFVYIILILLYLSFSEFQLIAQNRVRREIKIPDIPGFITLKCDFHTHTVFSDGLVWPSVRSEEAWRQGLDVLAITDHIEYQPHKEDLPTNHNRASEIASEEADELDLILLRGAEITRKMPPGHLNAIFLNDIDPVETTEYKDAIKAAADQGAFIFWNHPGWRQPDEIPIWYDEHTELLNNGWIHGIEVVNEKTYYPKVHKWCLDKNLTMFGNSDIHEPIAFEYDLSKGEHRAVTLVFAKEKSVEAVKEALFDHRTVVYHNNLLIGKKNFLAPLFNASLIIKNRVIKLEGTRENYIHIQNNSELDYELELMSDLDDISLPKTLILTGERTVLLSIKGKSKEASGKKQITIPYRVKNLLIAPDMGLPVEFKIEVTFIPSAK